MFLFTGRVLSLESTIMQCLARWPLCNMCTSHFSQAPKLILNFEIKYCSFIQMDYINVFGTCALCNGSL